MHWIFCAVITSSLRRERQQRDILVAAIDNLVDFAAAEEYALLEELPDEPHTEDIAAYESLCERYNLTYAAEENGQVLFAASVAAWWLIIDAETVVTYMTQGDERVRAWHLSLEGLSYRKSEFPPELIPPIEWGCRCFLVANGFASVQSSLSYKKCIERSIRSFVKVWQRAARSSLRRMPIFPGSGRNIYDKS